MLSKFNKSVISRMTLPKTKLFTKKNVIIVQVIINAVYIILSKILEKQESTEIGQ